MFKIKPFGLFLEHPPKPVCLCCGFVHYLWVRKTQPAQCMRCRWPFGLTYERII
jgi:hypothetical protein